ncbi:hypothetical protein DM02DRAFT_662000 [Periconia macrospinosa]|uniref:Rhodopsin domain-containing protein n=1 Tax=Periconia macrospinosa TaxID=97972 RepID=A0A2V1D5T8_9PLEO|nr:hypothetical protein DM02DRAFT_662000 [Periconia macrospinosa]
MAMDDRRGQIIVLNIAFMIASLLAVTTRLSTRIFLVKRIWADDVLITVALVLGLTQSACYIVLTRYGQGLHIQYLKRENVPAYTRVILISGFFTCLSLMFIRLSYLTFYLRLAVKKHYRILLYIWTFLVFASGIASSIVSMTYCIPWEKLWIPTHPGYCVDIKAFFTASSALNMVLDIVIFILPIPLLWALKLPTRQRLCLVVVFALGLIVVIASILRLHTLLALFNTPAYRKDNTWSTVDSMNWASVEVHLAILVSCTAAFKTLIQRFLPGIIGSLSGTKQSVSRRYTFTTRDGGYMRQGHTRDEPNSKSGIRESVHRTDETASQEHIMEDIEMPWTGKTKGVQASSGTSLNDCAENCLPDCSAGEAHGRM